MNPEPETERLCRSSMYADAGIVQHHGDREVRCGKPHGHAGSHAEYDEDGAEIAAWLPAPGPSVSGQPTPGERRSVSISMHTGCPAAGTPGVHVESPCRCIELFAADAAQARSQLAEAREREAERERLAAEWRADMEHFRSVRAERDSLREERDRLVAEVDKIAADVEAGIESAKRLERLGDDDPPSWQEHIRTRTVLARRLRALAAAPVEAPASPPESTHSDEQDSTGATSADTDVAQEGAQRPDGASDNPPPVGEGAALIAATEAEINPDWEGTARILARVVDERPHGCDGLCEQAAEHGMHPPAAEPEVSNWERDLIERQASEPVALGAGDIVFLANVEGPWTVTEWDFSETLGGWPTAYVRLDQRPDAESVERPSGEKPWLSRQVGSLIAGFAKRNLERWLPPHPGGYFGEPALAVLLVVDRLLSEIALKDSLIRAIQPPAAPVQPEERQTPEALLPSLGRRVGTYRLTADEERRGNPAVVELRRLRVGLAERDIKAATFRDAVPAAFAEIDRLRAALATAERQRDEAICERNRESDRWRTEAEQHAALRATFVTLANQYDHSETRAVAHVIRAHLGLPIHAKTDTAAALGSTPTEEATDAA